MRLTVFGVIFVHITARRIFGNRLPFGLNVQMADAVGEYLIFRKEDLAATGDTFIDSEFLVDLPLPKRSFTHAAINSSNSSPS